MNVSLKTGLGLMLFFGLFPLEGRAAEFISTGETCSRIEEMLVSVQLEQPGLPADEYAVMNENLKESFSRYCGNADSRDSGGLREAHYQNGVPLQANGSWMLPNGKEFQDSLLSTVRGGGAAILNPFLSAHRSCAGGCGYVSWGIWGDKKHQARRSCHNSGQAIDIHAITCGGRTYAAGTSRFSSYVGCMRGRLGVIFGNASHRDHAHFQLRGCNMCRGSRCGSTNDTFNENAWWDFGGNTNATPMEYEGEDEGF